jgi:hypothetical protein
MGLFGACDNRRAMLMQVNVTVNRLKAGGAALTACNVPATGASESNSRLVIIGKPAF